VTLIADRLKTAGWLPPEIEIYKLSQAVEAIGAVLAALGDKSSMTTTTTVRTIAAALIGLGNVNRNFLRILKMKDDTLARRYRLAFRIVMVADSSGVAVRSGRLRPGGDTPLQGSRRARL
jgi:hypothetical protein